MQKHDVHHGVKFSTYVRQLSLKLSINSNKIKTTYSNFQCNRSVSIKSKMKNEKCEMRNINKI